MAEILLLHGALANQSQMLPLLERLQGSLEVHTLDFIGHRGVPEEGFSLDILVSQVSDFVDSLESDHVHIFGYSMGGYVAMKLLENRNDIRSLTTLGTKYNWTAENAEKEVANLDADGIEKAVPRFAGRLKSTHGENNWRFVLDQTAKLMMSLPSRLVDSVRLPDNTQYDILVGDADSVAGVEGSRLMAEQIAECQFEILPNTPHPFERCDLDILARRILDSQVHAD